MRNALHTERLMSNEVVWSFVVAIFFRFPGAIAKSADSSSLRRTRGAGKAVACGGGTTGIMPADESSDELASARRKNVPPRFSPLQHDFAGHRVQFVRRIFPDAAA